MKLVIVFAAALLPALLLWLYVWKKDPQKEPTSRLLKATLWGVLISVPIVFVEMGMGAVLSGVGVEPTNFFGTTADAFLVAALPEESFKLLALWLVLRKNPYFDEHFDGIVYAVCVGLGFAAIENVLYVVGSEEWVSVAISRALLSVPGHYAFAVLMGYFYSVYHFVDHTPQKAICILLVPVLAHGFYDSLAFGVGIIDESLGAVIMLVLIYFCIRMQKMARRKVVAMIEKDNQRLIS